MASTTPFWTIGLIAAIGYGLSIGSFLNVVIYRLPLGQSVASPTWSYCPACRHRLGGADLVPLLSFLALGRKCRYCRGPISWRYFGVEALTGVLFTLVYLHDGWGADVLFDAVFAALLVPIFFIDLEHFFIPNELCAIGFAVGLAHNLYGMEMGRPGMWMRVAGGAGLIPASIGAAVICALLFHLISFFGLLYYRSAARASAASIGSSVGRFWWGVVNDYAYIAVKCLGFGLWLPAAARFIAAHEEMVDVEADEADALVSVKTREEIASEIENDEEQTGMGQGDAKLAGMIGANLYAPAFGFLKLSLLSFFLAVLLGTVVGVGMMLVKGRDGRTAIPFAPYLVVGALAALLVGPSLLEWYWRFAFPAR